MFEPSLQASKHTDIRIFKRRLARQISQFRNLRLRGLSKRKSRRGVHVAYLAPAHSSKSGSPLAPHSRLNGNGLLYVTSPPNYPGSSLAAGVDRPDAVATVIIGVTKKDSHFAHVAAALTLPRTYPRHRWHVA